MAWLTTATVLLRLRDFENRDAWEAFAERFRQPVVSFARGMGINGADAEDVAQETLMAFAQAYRDGRYDPAKGRLSRFLFGIAYRQSLRARSAAANHGAGAAAGVAVITAGSNVWSIPDEQTASGIWDNEWEQAVLERCLQQARAEVEPQTFRAFELVVRDGKSTEEAAELLQTNVKSVYNAKHRILKRVRELREEFEPDAPPASH